MKQSEVLLVEDEILFRSSLARGLSKLEGVSVSAVGTVGEALNFLEKKNFDLIISDINLPDRSGLELFDEIGKRSIPIPIILMTGYLSAYQTKLASHPFVDVIEKPIKLSFIRGLVKERLQNHAEVKQAPPFSAGDYLQLAAFGRHSVSILSYFGGRKVGKIIVHQGEVWRVEDLRGEGREAFRRLVSIEGAHHICETLVSDPGVRNLNDSWEFLLLDAARVKDEQAHGNTDKKPSYSIEPLSNKTPHHSDENRISANPNQTLEYFPSIKLPAAEDQSFLSGNDYIDENDIIYIEDESDSESLDVTSSGFEPETKSFSALMEEGIDALLVRDYSLAWQSFQLAELLRPTDPQVKANLQRLKDLGFGSDEKQ